MFSFVHIHLGEKRNLSRPFDYKQNTSDKAENENDLSNERKTNLLLVLATTTWIGLDSLITAIPICMDGTDHRSQHSQSKHSPNRNFKTLSFCSLFSLPHIQGMTLETETFYRR